MFDNTLHTILALLSWQARLHRRLQGSIMFVIILLLKLLNIAN